MRSFLFIITFLSVGCSSLPYKKTLMLTGAGVAAGTIYGLTKPEHQTQNATMYGALGGLSAAVAGLVLDIDEADGLKQKAENERLKIKLDEFQKRLEPQLISKGNSLFSSPLPKEVSGLVEPGEWKRFKLDQWVQDPYQQNTWYRQVEMFEITPPVSK